MKIFNHNDDDELSTTKYENATQIKARRKTDFFIFSLQFSLRRSTFYCIIIIGYRLTFSLFILLLLQPINKINKHYGRITE